MRLTRLLQLLSFVVYVLAMVCPMALGQAQRAIILGRVADPSGGAIPGVEVKVIEVATNVVRDTLTNESGNYEVPGLFPGTYRVEAASKGFKTTTIDNVIVQSAQRAEVNIQMQLGEVTDSVTVTASNERLGTASADVSTVFDSTAISNIPIGQGHAAMLMLQAVGADGNPGWVGNDVQPMQRAHGVRFNGSPSGTTEYTIDGSPNTQRGNAVAGGSMAYTPSPEVVEEVRVSTAIFDASQGHTGGSTVDLTLRSGKNDYHGTAAWNYRPAEWQANSWINNRQNIPRPDVVTTFWDLSGGGPVWLPGIYNGKDKTFFYYGFEKWSGLSGNPPGFATVPTAAQLGGDFSSLLALGPQYQLYDPESAYIEPNGRIARVPFNNNIIPSTRINDEMAKALAKYWPAPNTPGSAGGVQNYSYLFQPHPRKLWGSTLRVDHNLNKHKLHGKFLKGETGIYYTGIFDRTDIDFNHYSGRNLDLGVGDVWTISPTLIADFRVADMRFHWDVQATGEGMDYNDFALGYLSNLFDTNSAGFPYVNLAGYPSVASVNFPTFYGTGGSRWVSEIRTVMANFTKMHGNHSIRFGADIRQYIENWGNTDSLQVTYSGAYSSGPYDNSPVPPLGAALADFLMGKYATAIVRTNPQIAGLSTYQGFYVHDDWKLNSRLTLNLGLRYEREGPASERYDRTLAGFDANTENPIAAQAKAAYAASPIPEISPSQFQVKGGAVFAGTGDGRRTLYKANNKNFAARVGLAHRLTNNLLVNAGYGIYFVPYGQRMYTTIAPGYSTTTNSFSTVDNGLTFPYKTSNFFSSGLAPVTGSSLGLQTNLGQSLGVTALFGDLPSAYNQRWQGGVQMVFAGDHKVEVRYVGNRTIKMPLSTNLNYIPNVYLSTSTERDQPTIDNLTTLVPNPFFGIQGMGGSLATSRNIAKSSLLVAYPEFSSVTYNTAQGWSTYNALQMEFSRRFSGGLTFQTNYTYARTTDADSRLNAGDPLPWSDGPASNDRPHIWRLLGVYELPFGPGKPIGSNVGGFTSWLIGGWQIQGSSYYQSGVPIAWGNVLFRGNRDDIHVDTIDPDRMFNTDAGFEKLTTRQLSSNVRTFPVRLGNVRYQSDVGTDLSIIKNFEIKERYKAQFRFEGYNAFNWHRYTAAVNADPTNTAFGKISYSTSPRIVQMVLKFVF